MLPELKIAQLRHFVWVAELKGFHAAAEKSTPYSACHIPVYS